MSSAVICGSQWSRPEPGELLGLGRDSPTGLRPVGTRRRPPRTEATLGRHMIRFVTATLRRNGAGTLATVYLQEEHYFEHKLLIDRFLLVLLRLRLFHA